MGTVTRLEVKQSRHAIEQSLFGLSCDINALARLANDGGPFFGTEVMELRRLSYDLLAIANHAECLMQRGTK